MYKLIRAQFVALLLLVSLSSAAQVASDIDSVTTREIVDLIYSDNYAKAGSKLDSIQLHFREQQPTPGYVKFLLQVGEAFNEKGDYGATQQYCFMALGIASQKGWDELVAQALIDIGYSYYFLEQLDKGIEYGGRAIVLTKKLNLDTLRATAHNLVGILKAKSRYPVDSIMLHYNEALAIRTKQKNARGIASTISNIGLQLERQQMFEEALKMQKRSLQIDDSIGNSYGAAWSYQMIGELLIKMKRYDEANLYLTKAEEQSKKLKAREILLQTYRSRSQFLEGQSNFKEALRYSNLYNTLRDSIYNAGLASKVTFLQQSFETRERDQKIAKQQASIEAQQKIFIVVSFAVGIIVVLLFFYYRSYKQTLLLNSELQERTEEIQTQAEELTEANQALQLLNRQIAEQKEELQSQAEELMESNQTISILNERLQSDIEIKKEELFTTNEELVKHNNELMQFSFTVSHNLRAPVARMLGIMNLIAINDRPEEQRELIQLLSQSTYELDMILKDLNLIIDSRNQLTRVREKISFEEEWNKTSFLLKDSIQPEFVIQTDFTGAPYMYSVRAMLQNIFYNLVGNAIRYRSPERILHVMVSTYKENDATILTIADNGLGIDLNAHGQHVFKLYKRFHTHVAGKGLGLYLVKTQVEALGGLVSVNSELNKGTTFKVVLPDAENAAEQILLDKPGAKLYYDANINCMVIVWKRSVSSLEYHEVFETVLQTLQTYNTPAWIADLRNQGTIDPADQQWFMSTVLPQAVECGLKRIATVGFVNPIRMDYHQRMQVKSKDIGIDIRDFSTLDEAKAWMLEHYMVNQQSVV